MNTMNSIMTMNANLQNRLNETTNDLFQGYSKDSAMILPDCRTSTPILDDDRRPFIPRLNAALSSITKCDRNELKKRQIEKILAACLSALINGPDVFDGEEQADILNNMLSQAQNFAYLTNRLIDDAELITPADLLQSASIAEGSENDVQQHVTDNTYAVSIVNKPVRKRKKTDTDCMDSEEILKYLEDHITDEHCYKTLMTTPLEKVADDLEGIKNQLKHTNERVNGSKLQIN